MPYFPPQQTALDILNKLKTVDGSGSGLDADTIDGLHANELSTVAALNDLTDVTISTPSTNQVLLYNGSIWVNGTITSGVTDHGALTGLSDDDHPQYLLATGSRIGATSSRQVFTNGITTDSIRPSSDSTTALQLQKADGTAVVTIDTTNGRLGIGVTPLAKMHFANGLSGATPNTNYSDFVIERNGNPGIAILCPDANFGAVTFGSVSDNFGAFLRWNYTGRDLLLSTANATATLTLGCANQNGVLRIGANGGIGFGSYITTDPGAGSMVMSGNLGIGIPSPIALLDLAASTTIRASMRIRSGVAPTSPNDGDIWFDGTHLYCRIAGVTKQLDN